MAGSHFERNRCRPTPEPAKRKDHELQTPKAWHANYSVGHPLLDQQHQHFLTLCENAPACLLADHSQAQEDSAHVLLNELAEYARNHFREEEAILRDVGFPQLDAHVAEHHRYEERLADHLLAAIRGEIDPRALCHFVTSWWVEHITTSDAAYRDYLIQPR